MSNSRFDVSKSAETRNKYWNVKFSSKRPSAEQLLAAAEEYINALERENWNLGVHLAQHEITHWPRVRNLPREERKPFKQWLANQTCPLINGVPYEEQDAFYPWDYDRWKKVLSGGVVEWD